MDTQEIKTKIEQNFIQMEAFLESLKDRNQEMYNLSLNEYTAIRSMYDHLCSEIERKQGLFQSSNQEEFQLESMLRDTEIAIENATKFLQAQTEPDYEDEDEQEESTSMVTTDHDIQNGEVIMEEIITTPGGIFSENPMATKILISIILGSAMFAGKWMVDTIKREM